MNTKPDEETLARWLDDELLGEEQAAVEAWAAGQVEWLERREQARATRVVLGSAMSADEALPSAEFFNARILHEIEVRRPRPAPSRSRQWGWFLPATAAAGMALGFLLGRGGGESPEVRLPVAELAPVLYTPEKGVEAEYLAAEDATVIVLAGVQAIPDDWELPETAAIEREVDHTAAVPAR